MFAAALVLLRRRPVPDAVGSSAPTRTDQKLLTAPVATPLDTGIAEPQKLQSQEVAAVEPRPAVANASTQTVPAAAIVIETRPMEGVLDVTALMDAPLADLLLAALCKDPVGARRIFAKALDPGAAPVASRVPSTSGAPMPLATTNGDARAVAIGPPTTAAS
jgi:hypothetical protein